MAETHEYHLQTYQKILNSYRGFGCSAPHDARGHKDRDGNALVEADKEQDLDAAHKTERCVSHLRYPS